MRQARCSRCESRFFPVAARRSYIVRAAGSEAPAVGAPMRMRFGMDDPTLAARLGRTGLDGGDGTPTPVMTYTVLAQAQSRPSSAAEADRVTSPTAQSEWAADDARFELGATSPAAPEPVAARPAAGGAPPALTPALGEGDEGADERVLARAAAAVRDLGLPPGLAGGSEAETPEPVMAPAGGVEVESTSGRPVHQLLVALLFGVGGAAAGWYGWPTMRGLDFGTPEWNAVLRQLQPLDWTALGAAAGLLIGWIPLRWTGRTR